MKLLGLDYGEKRIGLAVTDESGVYIRGLPTIFFKKNQLILINNIIEIINKEKPDAIVIGLPLNSQGLDTKMSLKIREFAKKLHDISGLPINFVDESLTSKRAYDIIQYKKKKQRQKKENIDRISACLILQAFIEEQK
jgi:putative Holliday junction resolvase